MQVVSILTAIIATFFVAALILKKYKPHVILLAGGIVLLAAGHFFGITPVLAPEESSGLWLFDLFDLIKNILIKDAGETGMVIMAASAYAVFMNQVGASRAMVSICVRPLKKMGSPYLMLGLTYIVGQLLNIFVPSASGLSVLLMATVYPILTALGVSPLSATAVIASAACLDLGPASGASNYAAQMSGIDAMEYFIRYQVPIMIVVMPVVMISHILVQKTMDKKMGWTPRRTQVCPAGEDEAKVPAFYALLPVFPLILLLLFNDLVISSIHADVVSAMLMGAAVTLILEAFRGRLGLSESLAQIQVFFDAMGRQFASIITLIMAGEVFAEGLKHIGVIDLIISGCQQVGFGAVPMTILMVGIIVVSSIVMGSGAAPYYAFIALAPGVAGAFGIEPVVMIMAMQLATGMGRNMSPIAACVVASAGCAEGVDSIDVARRSVIPMLCAVTALIIADAVFFL